MHAMAKFFGTLSALVDSAVTYQVKPFQDTVKSYISDAQGHDALSPSFQVFREVRIRF